jgi:putative nucleotidyltransferase with HDIG domain
MARVAARAILELLRRADGQYFGEQVTQLEHALQCAHLARISGADDELVIAALLHDIGHLLEPAGVVGIAGHNRLGSDYLRDAGFSNRVCSLVAGHVDAKRYLTAVNPEYYARLSDASKQTLAQQGGPMSAGEIQAFENDPLLREKLRLRVWDEQAKVPGLTVATLETYAELFGREDDSATT